MILKWLYYGHYAINQIDLKELLHRLSMCRKKCKIVRMVWRTSCTGTTRGWITWIWLFDTPLVFTNIAILAVWISNTFWFTSSNSIWIRNQPRLAATNGVALGAWSACCTRTTRRWTARIFWPWSWCISNVRIRIIRL